MITFKAISAADFNGVQFVIQGDGVIKTFSVNLGKPPFKLNFEGVRPSEFAFDGFPPGLTATATLVPDDINGDILTVTLNNPPPADATLGISIAFHYSA